jgi:hypothetical protein
VTTEAGLLGYEQSRLSAYAATEWLRHRIFHRIDVADFGGFPRVCGRWVFCIGRFGLCEPSKVAKRHKGSGQPGTSRGCRHCSAVTERANVTHTLGAGVAHPDSFRWRT